MTNDTDSKLAKLRPLKLHHNAVMSLKEGLRQNRHLTFGEIMMANELIPELRRAAYDFLRIVADDDDMRMLTVADKNDPPDVVALKRRDLMTITAYARDMRSNCPDDVRDFAVDLANEAAIDFAPRATHKQAKPPQVADIERMRAAQAAEAGASGDQARRLDAVEGAVKSLTDGMSAMHALLQEMHSALRSERASSAPSETAPNTEKEG